MTDKQSSHDWTRRRALAVLSTFGVGGLVFQRALANQVAQAQAITADMVQQAEWIAGIELSDDDREKLAANLQKSLADQARIRSVPCDADVPPACVFQPAFFAESNSTERLKAESSASPKPVQVRERPLRELPSDESDVAFASLVDQSRWLAAGKITSVALTKIYLSRLKKYDNDLLCIVTLLEDTALEQAAESDARRRAGKAKGLLDGIPWVAKDLIAVPPWKTTWGAEPYREQVRPQLATVAHRLTDAGAVLLAKVSLGALAWGDVWFRGKTKNPWQLDQGSSGSSAGSAAAVTAGLASFAIGSETLGSIVSPCERCRVSGLRPTYGRISRFGCMPLAWSFDKLGPIARSIEDLAVVFATVIGPDGKDPSVVERPFQWPHNVSLKGLRISSAGAQLKPTEEQAFNWLLSQGAEEVPIQLPTRFPISAMTVMLTAEATTMFDDILRAEPNADLGLWPESFQKGQFISAVHYLRASRLRTMLIEETETVMKQVDVLIGADDLTLTNLTGHPSLIVAMGADNSVSPRPGTVKLTGSMFRESTLLEVGRALQDNFPATPDRPFQ